MNNLYGQELKNRSVRIPADTKVDSITFPKEKPVTEIDTIKKDTVPIPFKKALLDGKIKYKAEDYTIINQKDKTITLYNKAELYYTDIELTSGIIVMDYEKNEVYAGRIKDSTGTLTQAPVFKQGSNVVEPDSIRFNYKTKRALIWNSRTEQGELKLKAAISKKENDSVYFSKNVKITTSKDIDDPEYYFLASKIKFVPGKKVVTGPTNMYIADVPTPIAIPFAFFPMTDESQSGLIVPTFQDTRSQGYSLQNGGFYFALSDNYDLTLVGDYFTNGSYGLRMQSDYAIKYKFRGSLNVRFENLIQSQRGFPDYSKESIYNIQWSHSQDGKSSPNSRFSASVNLGSRKYFQQSINLVNTGSTLINNLSSSISYSQTFNTIPGINYSLTATHNQNTSTGEINMTLPTFQASVDRMFPFSPKDGIKKGMIKNINLQYNIRGENRINTTDSLFFKSAMFNDLKTGFQHSIPISTNFKIFKYFSVTAGSNYEEIWVFNTIEKSFDDDLNKPVVNDLKGFDSFRTYDFSTSIGTTIFGTFDFGENKKIQSIRHTMRPAVSYSYLPSFEQYYDTYTVDATGRLGEYTRFEGGMFGQPDLNYANNVGFNLSNTLEAKVTDRDSTKTEPKKIMLLNSFNLSTSYNIAADSLKLAPIRLIGGTNLLDNKMNINFGATLDPYTINNAGRRINTLNVENGGSLFRMTSANMTLNYSLSSATFDDDKKPKNTQGARNGGRDDDLFGTNVDLSDRRQSQFAANEDEEDKFSEFFKTVIPWDLTIAYSLTYGNNAGENMIIGNSLMLSGNVDLTPRWKMGASSGYDFVQKGVTFTQLRFERDLLSWRIDFNWQPLGPNASWGFFIGLKSPILSDLKYDKRSIPDRILN
jgi:lipopolysaccharide assembly outer membrane protein LptD (OstA)